MLVVVVVGCFQQELPEVAALEVVEMALQTAQMEHLEPLILVVEAEVLDTAVLPAEMAALAAPVS
jgi:hypothetical protein